MRTVLPLNDAWRFAPEFTEDYIALRAVPETWEEVDLPHTNRELPFNGFDESLSLFVSSYFRQIAIPAKGRHFIDFDGVMCACDVWVNGLYAGGHKGGYTPFSVETTRLAAPGSMANVLIRVDSTERKDIPPFGFVVDYLTYGGIYRDVSFRSQTGDYVSSVFARPESVLENAKSIVIEIDLDRSADDPDTNGGHPRAETIRCELIDGEKVLGKTETKLGNAGTKCKLRIDGISGIRLWDLDDPALYTVRVTLESETASSADAIIVDSYALRVGFRTARFEKDGFYLNGKRIKLIGLNRHQSWPYSGYAMPARAQRRDAEILKNELGIQIVRTSHYPQSTHFLDACDELGLLVFEEMPGWQHIGEGEWKDNECDAIREMIVRDRNRPSIVLWGVRVNESRDDDDFYARTNALARSLDPTRQTGGVRVIANSNLLEDVYTFNDFAYSGEKDGYARLRRPREVSGSFRKVPYLVTEFNGHMYPTKSFDGEERLSEHALRHAAVLDAAFADHGIAGAIGWCAFDYNTHKDFGSGDRICYHGVMDMFREPKYAAYAYATQMNPGRRVVMEAASLFSKGDRSAARLLPIEIWTNCDSVILWREGKRVGEFFPDRKEFPHLPHPPIVIRDIIGEQLDAEGYSARDSALIRKVAGIVFMKNIDAVGLLDKIRALLFIVRKRIGIHELIGVITKYAIGWGRENESFRIEGILAGKPVIERTYGGSASAMELSVRPDDETLTATKWDTTRIAVRIVDQYGNKNPYVAEAVSIGIVGPAKLIGPSIVPLIGGGGAFWIRTTGEAGIARITVTGGRFGEKKAEIRIEGK